MSLLLEGVSRALLSEPIAWAIQNALGIFVAALFVTVSGLKLPIACMTSILAATALLLLSQDRSAGSRIFAAALLCCCSLAGAVLGGAVVSLAFLARGEGEPLMSYLPKELQRVYPPATIAELQSKLRTAAPQHMLTELPPQLLEQLEAVKAALEKAAEGAAFSSAFWALLIVLPAALLVPLALARAYAPGFKGVIVQITALMAGNVVVFGVLAQVLTLRLFWQEVVLGFVYAGLASALCCLAAGCLVYVQSTHDEVRQSVGAILLDAGSQISRLASSLLERSGEADGVKLNGGALDQRGPVAVQQEAYRRRLLDLVGPAATPRTGSHGKTGSPAATTGVAAARAGDPSSMQPQWARLKRSLGMAAFEPPLLGLCSQPGASLAAYGWLKKELELLCGSIFALRAACQRWSLEELAAAQGTQGYQEQEQATSAVCSALATAAACCAGCAEALEHMPPLGACSGPAVHWRPMDASRWLALRADLAATAAAVADAYNEGRQASGLDFALEVDVQKSRAVLFLLPTVVQLLVRVEAFEAAAATALAIPAPAASSPATGKVDVEKGVEGEGGAAIRDPPQQQQPSLAHTLQSSPCASNAVTLLVMMSSLASWMTIAKGIAAGCRGVPAALSSKAALVTALRNPTAQFAFKFWLSNSLAMMGCILFLWKGPRREGLEGQVRYLGDWQPMYFWMASTICTYPNVEGSVAKGFMRTVGIGVGGLLGLAASSNGALMNSPYYTTAIVMLLFAFFSLPAVVAEFRFTLCMIAYTIVGLVLCAYLGCCEAHSTWQSFAGKAVPTALGALWATAFTALVLPNYASNDMLLTQADILRSSYGSLSGQYEEVMAAAQEGRAPDLSPLLANLQREAERIAGVGAKLRSSSVDRRLQPLAWLVLHTPPVVSLMQPRLKVLAGCAWASISTLAQVAWQPAHARPAGGAAQPAATSVIAGAYFKTMAADQGMTAVVRQMLQAQRELVEACADNLELGRLPAQVTALRERVAASLTAAIDARVACVAHFREQRPQLLAQLAGVPCQVTDLAFCGWMSSMISALDELLVLAGELASPPAQERDWLGGWLRAWGATRAQV